MLPQLVLRRNKAVCVYVSVHTPQAKADEFAATFSAALDALLSAPQQDPPGFSGVQPVNAISLCRLRCDCWCGSCQSTDCAHVFKCVLRGWQRGAKGSRHLFATR